MKVPIGLRFWYQDGYEWTSENVNPDDAREAAQHGTYGVFLGEGHTPFGIYGVAIVAPPAGGKSAKRGKKASA